MHRIKTNDVRSQAAYPLAEASRYLKIAPATLRSWVVGRRYPKTVGTGLASILLFIPRSSSRRCFLSGT